MAEGKETKKASSSGKYKATPRLFEWIPDDSPDFKDYMAMLKKGESADLKHLSPERLQYCLDNELITKE